MTETTALDLYIKKQLGRFDVTDTALEEIHNKYIVMSIRGVNDVEGYKAVKAARLHVKKLRCEVENKRKDLVADAIHHNKCVNAEAQRITERLVFVEDALHKQEILIDEEKERIKEKAAAALRAKQIERGDLLVKIIFSHDYLTDKFTCPYSDEYFLAGMLAGIPDEQFNAQYVALARKCEAYLAKQQEEKRAAEQAAIEAAEQANAERQRLAEQRREQEAREKVLAEREAALEKAERDKRILEDAERATKKALENAKAQQPVSIPDNEWQDDEPAIDIDAALKEIVKNGGEPVVLVPAVEGKSIVLNERGGYHYAAYWHVEICGQFKCNGAFLARSKEEAIEKALDKLHQCDGDDLTYDFEQSDCDAHEISKEKRSEALYR